MATLRPSIVVSTLPLWEVFGFAKGLVPVIGSMKSLSTIHAESLGGAAVSAALASSRTTIQRLGVNRKVAFVLLPRARVKADGSFQCRWTPLPGGLCSLSENPGGIGSANSLRFA